VKIKLITPAAIKNKNFSDILIDYEKRIKKFLDFQILETREEKIHKKFSGNEKLLKNLKKKEAERIDKKVSSQACLISLDEKGKIFSVDQFLDFYQKIEFNYPEINFIIGGANGLSDEILQKSHYVFCLSSFVLTQDLARLVLLEVLFRTLNIKNNIPFHKE